MLPGVYDRFQHWCNQSVYIYSDPHFNDEEQRKMCPYWPDDEEQVKMINSKVGRKDTLIILGDCGDLEYIKKLRGYKILIMGNHDTGATKYKRKIEVKEFALDKYQKHEAIEEMKRLYPGCKYSIEFCWNFTQPFECWEVSADNCLFDEVYEGPLFIGEKLLLSHEPIDFPFALNLHGHDHSGWMKYARTENFCSNVINFTPVNLNQYLKFGPTSKINSIHRSTINEATKRKKHRQQKGNK